MKEIHVPFSMFDFFAVLIPGAVGAFGLYLLLNPQLSIEAHEAAMSKTVFSAIENEIIWVTCIILLSYLLGHILYGLSELLIDAPIELLRSLFGQETVMVRRNPETDLSFWVVRSIVQEHMPRNMALADVYIATSSMFESLVLATSLIIIALLRGLFVQKIDVQQVLPTLLPAILLLPTFFFSYRRYKRNWNNAILNAYDGWKMVREEISKENDT